jgi:hypothetical protein
MTFNFQKVPKDEEREPFPNEGLSDEEFASFCQTPEAMKRIPLGVVADASGLTLWIDGAGQKWTREGYTKRFGFDPKPVWDRMKRQNIVKLGGFK